MSETVIQRTREEDVQGFSQAFPSHASQAEAAIQGKRITSISETEQQLLDSVYEMHDLMARIGVKPATVVNLHPVPLHSGGPQLSMHVVPACPVGQEFELYVIKSYNTDVQDKGGRFEAKPVLPIDLAKDILQQHSKSDILIRGGIVIYMGDHVPNAQNLKDINEARKKMVNHYKAKVEEANRQWVKAGRNSNVILDPIFTMAEYLVHHRYLQKKPDWMLTSRNQEDIVPECPSCGSEPSKQAFSCKQCGWILNAEKAYELGAISATSPDGVRALSRLSREKLKAMGISELIEETTDERKEREKSESKAAKKK